MPAITLLKAAALAYLEGKISDAVAAEASARGTADADLSAQDGTVLNSSITFLSVDTVNSTDTNYILTPPAGLTITAGTIVGFVPHVPNGANATLTIGGVSRSLRNTFDGSGGSGANLTAGRLYPDQVHLFRISNNAGYVGILPNNMQDINLLQGDMNSVKASFAPIPTTASQASTNDPIVATPILPFGSVNGGIYMVPVPLDKALGGSLTITQGIFTRGISGGSSASLKAGDRIIYRIDSNGAGTLLNVILASARLAVMDEAINRAPQIVHQFDGSIPARPEGADTVFWRTWDDPSANMKPKDLWFDLPEPVPPAAPDVSLFYLRPTLGSTNTDLVVRGVNLDDYIPILSGMIYVVGAESPVTISAASPQSDAITAGLSGGVETFVQLALSNLAGTGQYSGVKFYTPVSNAEFSHPLTARAPSVDDPAQGTYGFKNVVQDHAGNEMRLKDTGAEPGTNRNGWMQTDVGGLNGDNIYAQVDLINHNGLTQAQTVPKVRLGVNNTWPGADSNVVETGTSPDGIFLIVGTAEWSLVTREGFNEVTIASGALAAIPTSARIERQGTTITCYVDQVQVLSQILTPTEAAHLNESEGVMVSVARPSGANSARFRAANFVAGKLVI